MMGYQTSRFNMFAYDGAIDNFDEDASLLYLRSKLNKNGRTSFDEEITYPQMCEIMRDTHELGYTPYPNGYLICHNYEGIAILDHHGNIVFGKNRLLHRDLELLCDDVLSNENKKDIDYESQIKHIERILDLYPLSDIYTFQLHMLKAKFLSDQSQFNDSLSVLHKLSSIYSQFDEEIQNKISNHKGNTRFLYNEVLNFDYGNLRFLLAENYYYANRSNLALDEYKLALNAWDGISYYLPNKDIMKCHINIGTIYGTQNQYNKAYDHFEQALEINETENDIDFKILIVLSMVNIKRKLLDFETSLDLLLKLNKSPNLSKESKYRIYSQLGIINQHLNLYESRNYFEKCFDLVEDLTDSNFKKSSLFYYSIITDYLLDNYSDAFEKYKRLSVLAKKSQNQIAKNYTQFISVILNISGIVDIYDNPILELWKISKDESQHSMIRTQSIMLLLQQICISRDYVTEALSLDLRTILDNVLEIAGRYKLNSLADIIRDGFIGPGGLEKIDSIIKQQICIAEIET